MFYSLFDFARCCQCHCRWSSKEKWKWRWGNWIFFQYHLLLSLHTGIQAIPVSLLILVLVCQTFDLADKRFQLIIRNQESGKLRGSKNTHLSDQPQLAIFSYQKSGVSPYWCPSAVRANLWKNAMPHNMVLCLNRSVQLSLWNSWITIMWQGVTCQTNNI